MVMAAAQVEAVRDSAAALVRAYTGLRSELILIVESAESTDLVDELDRLFPPMEEPEPFNSFYGVDSHIQLATAAEDARTRLGQLGGWVQGLIDELTFQERLQLDAEARARNDAKPPMGFAGSAG